MRFNGKDLLTTVGSGVSICKEIPPFMIGRSLTTLAGTKRVYLGTTGLAQQTYILKLNIYGGTMQNAWEMRQKIAEWAYSDAETPLIPTHQPSIYYNAICQGISNPTFVYGTCTVDVTFLIPTPFAYSASTITRSGTSLITFSNAGTADPVVKATITPSATITPTVYVNGALAFKARYSVQADVPIEVDFENRTYKVNGMYANEQINFLQTDWTPGWRSGTNSVQCDSSQLTVEVVRRWL